MRKELRQELGQALYTHLAIELPFLRRKLTNPEINILVECVARWFCSNGSDPITLAKAVIKVMQEQDKSVAEKATPEPEFLNELDKI